MNKKYTLGILALMMIGSVFAVWVYSYTGNHLVSIAGGSDNGFLKFDNSFIQPLIYENGVGEVFNVQQFLTNNTATTSKNVTFEFETNKTDIEDACLDFENDISVVWKFNGNEEPIVSGDVILLPVGESFFHVETNITSGSCPQIVNTTFSITEN